jgi:hypothetical protein
MTDAKFLDCDQKQPSFRSGFSIIGKNLLAAELLQRGALHAGVLVLG